MLRPMPIEPIPTETARVAHTAFAKGNRYLQLAEELDMDSLKEGERPAEWRAPAGGIYDPQHFEAYTSGRDTAARHHSPLSPPHRHVRCCFAAAYRLEPSHRRRGWLIHEQN
jgi:hypothetical protein